MLVWILHSINAMLSRSLSPLSTTSLAHWLIRLEIILTNFKSKMQAEGWRWTTSVLHPPTLPSTGQTHSDSLILCSIVIYLSSINSSTIHHKKETSQWICCSAISQLLQIQMHINDMADESKMGKKSLTFPVLVPLLWICETIQGQGYIRLI